MENLGFYLIGVSILIFFLARFFGRKNVVKATNGSVAVGKNNDGPINVTKIENSNDCEHFWSIWNLLTGLCTLLGLALTIWPIK